MKKRFMILIAVLLFLSGCGSQGTELSMASSETSSKSRAEDKLPDVDDPVEEENTLPGSWTVPEGWVKAEQYSSKSKIFYVEEGHEGDRQPDNISIEVGKNRYSAEEHEEFRDAILRQLLMQTQGLDAELTGDGTFTEQDYILYIFTITEEDVVTSQYYIVGDQRYCLVHLTNFTGSDRAVEAARSIADSFVWENTED